MRDKLEEVCRGRLERRVLKIFKRSLDLMLRVKESWWEILNRG